MELGTKNKHIGIPFKQHNEEQKVKQGRLPYSLFLQSVKTFIQPKRRKELKQCTRYLTFQNCCHKGGPDLLKVHVWFHYTNLTDFYWEHLAIPQV